MNVWNNNNKSISIETIQITTNILQALLNEQSSVQRQANLLNEITESLLDSVENANFFR
jgi:hypothetical protein